MISGALSPTSRRHRLRALGADDAVLVHDLGGHSEVDLQFGGVGDEAAAEVVGAAGDVRERVRQQSSRA